MNLAFFTHLSMANRARQMEWDPEGKIDIAYRGNELGGEAGEAQNVIKKIARERLGIKGSRATAAQLGEELADVVICADLIATSEGLELWAEIIAKFNRTSQANGLGTKMINIRSALWDVAGERQRQIAVEGWSEAHDDEHLPGSLAQAAAAYAANAYAREDGRQRDVNLPHFGAPGEPPPGFPWSREYWKPKDPRTNLIRAAALILAEIDRLDREEQRA